MYVCARTAATVRLMCMRGEGGTHLCRVALLDAVARGLPLLVEDLMRVYPVSRLPEQIGDAKELPLVAAVALHACTRTAPPRS